MADGERQSSKRFVDFIRITKSSVFLFSIKCIANVSLRRHANIRFISKNLSRSRSLNLNYIHILTDNQYFKLRLI